MAFGYTRSRDENLFETKLEGIQKGRRNRFRILVCIDGTDASYDGIRFAAKIGYRSECDIILLYVRPIDQGLRSGGLQVRVARENMLDWGLELPGIRNLKKGFDMLAGGEEMSAHWTSFTSHTDTWSDPLGDNKVEYRHESGKTIVLKLKTAPDPASGILDQYELGPYNLIIMGALSHWRGGAGSFFNVGVTQKIARLAPCSVLVARGHGTGNGTGYLICTDGTRRSLDATRRVAVLAKHSGYPITLFCVASQKNKVATAVRVLEKATEMLSKMEIEVAEAKVAVGDPTEKIVEVSNDYLVVAVADSGKKWFHRLFVSGVAYNVMGASNTSVLNVR